MFSKFKLFKSKNVWGKFSKKRLISSGKERMNKNLLSLKKGTNLGSKNYSWLTMIGLATATTMMLYKNNEENKIFHCEDENEDEEEREERIRYEAELKYEKMLKLIEEKKFLEAIEILIETSRLGHSMSQLTLGKIFLEGKYVDPDPDQGIFWLIKSSQQNNPIAMLNLGMVLESGANGVPQDIGEAVVRNKKNY